MSLNLKKLQSLEQVEPITETKNNTTIKSLKSFSKKLEDSTQRNKTTEKTSIFTNN